MKTFNYFTLILCLLLPFVSSGKEIRYLLRSPRALLMGDAFTAIADDDYTLFYNPASLGKKSLLDFHVFNPGLEITNALDELDRFEDFPEKDAAAIADRIIGFPVYIHLGAVPTLKFGPFGISLFASATTSIVLRNSIHPNLAIDYRYDRGFIAGGSFPVFEKNNMQTKVGASIKHFNRQGIFQDYDLFGTELLNKINSGDNDSINKIRESLGFSKGDAWGGDIGVEHKFGGDTTSLTLALSVLDVGGTQFHLEQGDQKIPKQDMSVNIGAAYRQDFTLLDYSISFDMHPINQEIELLRKFHLGFELGIPLIRIMAGWNGGYLSYGASFKLWPVKVTAGFYSVELGSKYKEQPGKRAFVYFNLFDFSFDA